MSKNSFSLDIAAAVAAKYKSLALDVASGFSYVQAADILAIISREAGSSVSDGSTSADLTGDNGNSIGVMQVDITFHPEYTTDYLRNDRNNLIAGATIFDKCLSNSNFDHQAAYGAYNGAGVDSDYAIVAKQYYDYFKGEGL